MRRRTLLGLLLAPAVTAAFWPCPTAAQTTTPVGGATVSNTSTDANALASADTYINNFRKGNASVALTGPGSIPLLAGTPVNVDLARIGFNFGTAVPGTSAGNISSYLGTNNTA